MKNRLPNKQKILYEKPYDHYLLENQKIINCFEPLLNDALKGNYYVDISKYNNSGNCQFSLSTRLIDAKTALIIFRQLKGEYKNFEVTIHKINVSRPVAYNQSYFENNK